MTGNVLDNRGSICQKADNITQILFLTKQNLLVFREKPLSSDPQQDLPQKELHPSAASNYSFEAS